MHEAFSLLCGSQGAHKYNNTRLTRTQEREQLVVAVDNVEESFDRQGKEMDEMEEEQPKKKLSTPKKR